MILRNNLYTVLGVDNDGKGTTYTIGLNPECIIYKVHFPEMPITPGVCIIQIVNELLEDVMGRTLRICGVKNAKFLAVLQPDAEVVKVTISNIKTEAERVGAQAIVYGDNGVNYAKISLQSTNA